MNSRTCRSVVLEWALLCAAVLLAVAFAAAALYSVYVYHWPGSPWVQRETLDGHVLGPYSLVATLCFPLSAAAIAGYAWTVRRRRPRWYRWAIPTGILGGLVSAVAIATLPLAMFIGFFSDPIYKDLPGDYVLMAIEDPDNLSILYDDPQYGIGSSIGSVGPGLVDVGWNDHYIVATDGDLRYPDGQLSYYYIDLDYDAPPANGPFLMRVSPCGRGTQSPEFCPLSIRSGVRA
jgi:hypothetical protein